MADTPILEIPIDSSQFDGFLDRFQKFQEELKEQPGQWEKVNRGVSGLQTGFEKSLQSFEYLNTLAQSSKLSGQSSFIVSFAKASDLSAKSWEKISRDVGVVGRNLAGIERFAIGAGAFGAKLLGGVVGAGAAVFGGVVESAHDLASQNSTNRQLGLKPGEAASFDAHYQKMGGSDALLAKISQAKVDPSKWAGLVQGGVSVEDIKTLSPTEIAAQFLENAGARFKQMGSSAGPWATGTHVTDFADLGTLQQASTYGHDEFAKTHDDYAADVPKLALRQQELDQGTEAKAKFDVAFDESKTAIESALVKLAPELTKLTTEFSDTVRAFSQSGELQRDIDGAIDAFKKIEAAGDWVANKLNKLFGNDTKDGKPDSDVTLKGGSFAAKASAWASDTLDALNGRPHAPSDSSHDLHYTWAWNQQNKPTGAAAGNADLSSLDQANGFQPGFLKNIERQESSNGRNMGANTNDSAGPAGWFQIDKATAARLGVGDRMNEGDAAAGAAKDFSQLLQKYHGDTAAAVASYDGFSGLDRDIAQYGSEWRDHLDEFGSKKAVAETKKYLQDIAANGTDLRYQGDDNQQFIAAELAKHAVRIKQPATADDNGVLNGQRLFSMPQAGRQQTLPVANIQITTVPGSSVQTSLGGLTA